MKEYGSREECFADIGKPAKTVREWRNVGRCVPKSEHPDALLVKGRTGVMKLFTKEQTYRMYIKTGRNTMANRTAARKYGKMFEQLATNPTPENMQAAQTLYEENFCRRFHIGSHCTEDFHVGEMYCVDALLALNVKRHPGDEYLRVRGDFQVMQGT